MWTNSRENPPATLSLKRQQTWLFHWNSILNFFPDFLFQFALEELKTFFILPKSSSCISIVGYVVCMNKFSIDFQIKLSLKRKAVVAKLGVLVLICILRRGFDDGFTLQLFLIKAALGSSSFATNPWRNTTFIIKIKMLFTICKLIFMAKRDVYSGLKPDFELQCCAASREIPLELRRKLF